MACLPTRLTFSRPAVPGFLHKCSLQEAAQPLCAASMTLPEAGGYYTAWSSMATLVKHKLVLREGNPPRSAAHRAGTGGGDSLDKCGVILFVLD